MGAFLFLFFSKRIKPQKEKRFNVCDERKRIFVLSRKKLLWAVVNRRKNTGKYVGAERESKKPESGMVAGDISVESGAAAVMVSLSREVRALHRGVR